MTLKILIRKRTDDYMAFVEGHLEIWDCGRDINTAIGNLMRSHQKFFDIKIEDEKDKEK